jgi:glycosyltransferase involved in cell wall biosynthesis
MKVLWFTNTPCGASEKLSPNLYLGGWLNSLELELNKIDNIELNICFYWETKIEPFTYKKTNYYPIYRSKMSQYINRVFGYFNDDNEIKQIHKIIDLVNPDIIHIHGTEENFGLLQEQTKKPTVISIQGLLLPYTEKYFVGIPLLVAFIYEDIKNKILLKSSYKIFRDMKKYAAREQRILLSSKNIIGRTSWDRRVTNFLSKDCNYYVVNETLRKPFYENEWLKPSNQDCFQITTIMSGGIYKGLETIVKTAKLLSQYKKFKFQWNIIGQTESSQIAKIIKRWLGINYRNLNISLIGSKNENEIVDILKKTHIYCQVSHIENSPNSVCEAMLLGLPVVASFAGGTDSLIDNYKNGILVQDGDSYSFAGALFELFQNEKLMYTLGLEAKVKAEARHDKTEIVSSLLKTYEIITKN